MIWLIIVRRRAEPHQREARCFHLHVGKLAPTDGGMTLEEGRTRREFLWFPVASDLCNQRAKLLMSKSTSRTQTVYTHTLYTHICRHTQSELLVHELCRDLWFLVKYRTECDYVSMQRNTEPLCLIH